MEYVLIARLTFFFAKNLSSTTFLASVVGSKLQIPFRIRNDATIHMQILIYTVSINSSKRLPLIMLVSLQWDSSPRPVGCSRECPCAKSKTTEPWKVTPVLVTWASSRPSEWWVEQPFWTSRLPTETIYRKATWRGGARSLPISPRRKVNET